MRIRRGGRADVLAPALPGARCADARRRLRSATASAGSSRRRRRAEPAAGSSRSARSPRPAVRRTTGALNERDRIWADELASLVERAGRAQWDATRDIPWEAAAGLPDHVEQAVAQVMTYIAQNEYAALYVPCALPARR